MRAKWAETPRLLNALETQQTVDPDRIFGLVQPVALREIFDKPRKFRPRTSSANWSGADKLTNEEQLEYRKVMGYEEP